VWWERGGERETKGGMTIVEQEEEANYRGECGGAVVLNKPCVVIVVVWLLRIVK